MHGASLLFVCRALEIVDSSSESHTEGPAKLQRLVDARLLCHNNLAASQLKVTRDFIALAGGPFKEHSLLINVSRTWPDLCCPMYSDLYPCLWLVYAQIQYVYCSACAHLCLQLEAWDAAMQSCDSVLRTEPTNVKALFRKGKVSPSVRETVWVTSASSYKPACQIPKLKSTSVICFCSQCFASKGDTDGAIACLREALKQDPSSKVVTHSLLFNSLFMWCLLCLCLFQYSNTLAWHISVEFPPHTHTHTHNHSAVFQSWHQVYQHNVNVPWWERPSLLCDQSTLSGTGCSHT